MIKFHSKPIFRCKFRTLIKSTKPVLILMLTDSLGDMHVGGKKESRKTPSKLKRKVEESYELRDDQI